jgi:hypothetical protein
MKVRKEHAEGHKKTMAIDVSYNRINRIASKKNVGDRWKLQ